MVDDNNDFFKELEKAFKANVQLQRDRRAWMSIAPSEIINTMEYLRKNDFDHLSTISATDWLEDNTFELTYHLWSYSKAVLLTIKTRISRENPIIESVNKVYGTNAEACEREIHELFGIEFEGNLDLTSLFLEDWEGPPPFRKDFDWHDYVRQEHYDINNPREKTYFGE